MAEQVPGRVPGRMSDSLTVEIPTAPQTGSAPKPPVPIVTPAPSAPAGQPPGSAAIAELPESDAPGEPAPARDRTPGWREVLIIAAVVVVVVLAIQVVTSNLPVSIQNLLFNTPLVIVVLVGGTVGLLVRITRRSST